MASVEKYAPEAQDITASIRDLPTVKTHIGRARAWLRLALMQKKLGDYLQALVDNRDEALAEYYEPYALMMSDEIILIMGILVGLNVIDCNLCVKEEDLDSQQGVIDFSLYLRSSSRTSPLTEVATGGEENGETAVVAHGGSGSASIPVAVEGTENMTAVLDQKNYIEELNRHLKYRQLGFSFLVHRLIRSFLFQCHREQPARKGGITDDNKCLDEGGLGYCPEQSAVLAGRECCSEAGKGCRRRRRACGQEFRF